MSHNIRANYGTQLLMQSSVYGRLGMSMFHEARPSRLTFTRPESPRRYLLRDSSRLSCQQLACGRHCSLAVPKSIFCEIGTAPQGPPKADTEQATQIGQYKQAASMLSSIETSFYRTLRIQQYSLIYTGLLKLKRVLRR